MHYGQNVKQYQISAWRDKTAGALSPTGYVVMAHHRQYTKGKTVLSKAAVRVFPCNGDLDRAYRQAAQYTRAMNRRLGSRDPKNPWNPLHDGKRWCEDINDCGLRVKGAAHDIINLRHTGYYMDGDVQSDVTHGLVLQMPASKEGFCRYLAGRSDPSNDGAALIDFSTWYDDLDDAARAAEHDAEQEREWKFAWDMGTRASGHDEEAKMYRTDLLDLLVSSKKEGRGSLPKDGAIYRAIVNGVEHLLDKMREVRKERDKLIDDAPTYDKALRGAFNEGFGREVV